MVEIRTLNFTNSKLLNTNMCNEKNNYKYRMWKSFSTKKPRAHMKLTYGMVVRAHMKLHTECWLVLTLRPWQNGFWSDIHYLEV